MDLTRTVSASYTIDVRRHLWFINLCTSGVKVEQAFCFCFRFFSLFQCKKINFGSYSVKHSSFS